MEKTKKNIGKVAIPGRISLYTIAGLGITGVGLLTGFFLSTNIGFSLSVIGLLLILFNFYYRFSANLPETTTPIPTKLLFLFWVTTLTINYLITNLFYNIFLLGFFLALVMRSTNIVLRRLYVKDKVQINKLLLIPVVGTTTLTFLCAFYFPVGYLYDIQGIFYELSWQVGNALWLIFTILISAIWVFPALTELDVALNYNNPTVSRKKFIYAGIKMLIPMICISIFQVLTVSIGFILTGGLHLGSWLMLISAGITIGIGIFIPHFMSGTIKVNP
ncbi:MAG: hypothetical protein ACTSRS_17450 [Candidatus Helarchaeota archaeon]